VPLFFHDTVLPKDPDGFSIWQLEHFLEHRQFVQIGIGQSPMFTVPDYDLSVISSDPILRQSWLSVHQTVHDALRIMTNVNSGIDFSSGDLNQDDYWFQWMDDHAAEHRAFRQALNLT
jgi:hypothetical protein